MEAWKICQPFVTGSISGCLATCTIQPIDMVKVRIQLGAAEGGSTSPVEITKNMLREEGVGAFYKGLSAGLTRQVLYTGARLGLYDKFTALAKDPNEKSMPFWKTSVCALSAGGIAAVFGNPADLALIRMQADTMLPEAERRNYRGVGHALTSIAKDEGVGGLLKGAAATSTRAMALNFGMLAFNTLAKDQLEAMGVKKGSNAQTFGASAVAGFFASFFSLPFDYVKTQIQKMKPDPKTGELPFKGPLDCAMKQIAAGGPQKLWSGFPTYYVRIAPHAMITLIAQDAVKKTWKSMGLL
jgi:solute carrier family 25 oxoglutarate transporter 11